MFFPTFCTVIEGRDTQLQWCYVYPGLVICVRGYTYHGDTHITVTPVLEQPLHVYKLRVAISSSRYYIIFPSLKVLKLEYFQVQNVKAQIIHDRLISKYPLTKTRRSCKYFLKFCQIHGVQVALTLLR